MTEKKLQREDLFYPELSYRIVGCAFEVYNVLGSGYHEKYYQRALQKEFQRNTIRSREQVGFPLYFRESIVGKERVDFIVEEKIIVEIKKGDRYSKRHIDQVLGYLKASNLLLAILINFGHDSVKFKRIINSINS